MNVSKTYGTAVMMKHFILDTDWFSDCDDALAVRILANLHRQGKIKVDGIVINASTEYAVPALSAFLQYSKVTDIPIALDKTADDFRGEARYQKCLASLPSLLKCNDNAENPLMLYRRILSKTTDKIHILEIGFLQVLARLLQSQPDEISPLSGLDLIKEKVAGFWVMGGNWSDASGGKEHNFCNNQRASCAASYFCRVCPVPVTFLGFEIGNTVISGTKLRNEDPLKRAMIDCGYPNGRCSWDPMLVLLGVSGDLESAGYRPVYGQATVDPDTGWNYFTEDSNGIQRYVIKTKTDSWYANLIDQYVSDLSV